MSFVATAKKKNRDPSDLPSGFLLVKNVFYRIHVTGIFTYIWLIFMVNAYMDGMGMFLKLFQPWLCFLEVASVECF